MQVATLVGISSLQAACGDEDRISLAGCITADRKMAGSHLGPDVDARLMGLAGSESESLAGALELIVAACEW
ncbi:MAG: hypothetical protein OXG86_06060 [Chloroflexi bacterium]|nr:hypothetical protein [Chloroflexota bacterium]